MFSLLHWLSLDFLLKYNFVPEVAMTGTFLRQTGPDLC